MNVDEASVMRKYKKLCEELEPNVDIETPRDGAYDVVFILGDGCKRHSGSVRRLEWIKQHPESVVVKMGPGPTKEYECGGNNDLAVWKAAYAALASRLRIRKVTYT